MVPEPTWGLMRKPTRDSGIESSSMFCTSLILFMFLNSPSSSASNDANDTPGMALLFAFTAPAPAPNLTRSPTIDLATKQFYTIGLSTLPSGYQMCKWWNILYEFVEQFINIHYPTEYIKNDAKHFVDMMFLAYPGLEIDYKGMTYKQNLIDICVSLLNVNVVHESYSNSVFAGYAMNPFVQSTTWLENDSPDLVDHISNMQNQFTINMVFESTKVGSKCMGDDFSHLCMGYKKENELVAFGAFRNSISQLRSWFEGNNLSPEYWPLHPDNIKCSVRW